MYYSIEHVGSHFILPIKLLEHRTLQFVLVTLPTINMFAYHNIVNAMLLYNAVSSPYCSRHFIMYVLADLFKPTPS